MNLRLAIAAVFCVFTFGCGSCLVIPPLAYPCTRDGGVDAGECPVGWRCGLEDRCHPTGDDAGAPYACQQDSDCEAGWRCSVAGVCAESSNELLGPQYEGALDHQLLNPLVLTPPPLLFSHAAVRNADSSVDNVYVTLVDGGLLDVATLTSGPDGGALSRDDRWLFVGDATALASFTNEAFLVVDGGVLVTRFDGGAGYFLGAPGARGLRVRQPQSHVVALFDDAGYLDLSGNPASPFVATLPGACAGDPVLDLATLQGQRLTDAGTLTGLRACALASSRSGVFFADYGLGGGFLVDGGADGGLSEANFPAWAPLPSTAFAPTTCGVTPALTVTGLFPGQDGLGVALTDATGTGYAGLVDYDFQDGDSRYWEACTPDQPCCGRLGGWLIEPCAICAGQTLAEVRPTLASPAPAMVAHCVAPGGGSTWFLLSGKGSACANAFPLGGPTSLFSERAVYNAANPTDLPYTSAHGGLWTGALGRYDEGPRLLGQRPAFAIETDAGVLFFANAQQLDATGANNTVQDTFLFTENLGLSILGHNGSVPLVTKVRGRGSWAVEQNLNVKDFDLPPGYDFISITASTVTPSAPFTASLVPTRDGGSELVLSSFDTIYSADVTSKLASPTNAAPVKTGLRLVPAPGSAIVQASFDYADGGEVFSADGGPLLLHAYALTNNGLFEIEVANEAQWRATVVPVQGVTVVSVWLDRGHGRLGLDDGTVLSLPGLVRLSGPLPGATPVVKSYVVMCHQPYALSAQGLYRLMRDGDGGTGHWVQEPLEPQLAGDGDDFGLDDALLQTIGDEVYLGTHFGGALVLRPDGGCD